MPIIRSPLRSPIRSSVYNAMVGPWAGPPSLVFPSNMALFDASFATKQYYGLTQPDDSTNNDDGRMLRAQIVTTQPNFVENADGSLRTYAATSVVRNTTRGLANNSDRTNRVIQNRSINNAAFTLVGCTAAKDQTGRTGVANSASSVILTATTATITQAITDATSSARSMWVEAKQITGSGGVLTLSMDGGATFPPVTSQLLPGAGALSYTKYRIPLQTLANPSAQIKITGAITDKWAIDFVEVVDFATGDPDLEMDPIATTTVAVQNWRDRPTAFNTAAVPSAFSLWMASSPAMVFYFEFWYRRDGSLIASDGAVNITITAAAGASMFGATTANNPTVTTDFHNPTWNKFMGWKSAAGNRVCLNGGAVVAGVAGSTASALTHADFMTNGAGVSRTLGGLRRFWAGTTIPSDAVMQAFTT